MMHQKQLERWPIMTHHPISPEHNQASLGNGWSRIYLEALEVSKKFFQAEAGIGDSLSSQAKRSLSHSSTPGVGGWKSLSMVRRLWFLLVMILSLYTSFTVHDLSSDFPCQRCHCTKPELSNRMIAGSTDASPVWPLAISSSKSVKGSLERQPPSRRGVQSSYPSNFTAVD